MRHRSFIAVAVLLVLLVVGAGGVAVLDARGADHIAKGVRVGGVAVGGQTPAQARAALRRRLLSPLRTPVAVRAGGRTYHLSAREARISANVGGMVDEAVTASRRGSVFARAARELQGTPVDVSLPARVTFSRAAVRRLIARIARGVHRDPRDASVSFAGGAPQPVRSREGAALDAAPLERRILASVARPGAPRTFTAHTRPLRPKVTTADLTRRYGTIVVVDRPHFQLKLFKNLRLVKTYPVAVGRQGLETPAGLYAVQSKQVNPSWHVPNSSWAGDLAGKTIPPGPDDPIKARWLGFNGGAGIHGTDEPASIGSAASHGCVRMRVPDVIDLYPRVPLGAPVYVA